MHTITERKLSNRQRLASALEHLKRAEEHFDAVGASPFRDGVLDNLYAQVADARARLDRLTDGNREVAA